MAEVARAALESHGIAATVSSAHLGWDITSSPGIAKLLITEDSVQNAEEVLASIQGTSAPSESEAPEGDRSNWTRTVIQIGGATYIAAALIAWLLNG